MIDEIGRYSNHAIGSRNLCLSILVEINDANTLFVPTQNRRSVQAFTFDGQGWKKGSFIDKEIDFFTPLPDQLEEGAHSLTNDQCIDVP